MNLTNQFKLIGNVYEGKIKCFPSYYKATFSINIDKNTSIFVTYFVSNRYNKQQYKKFTELISKIKTESTSYVYVDSDKVFEFNGKNERLFLMGNLSTDGERLFFNANYIEIANKKIDNFISIRIDGQWIDDSHLLTLQNDSPLVFEIARPLISTGICSNKIQLHCGYFIENGIVNSYDSFLEVIDSVPQGKELENLENLILEWDIIKNNS